MNSLHSVAPELLSRIYACCLSHWLNVAAFNSLPIETENNSKLQQHSEYVRRNWIESTLWPPTAWSVFRQPIRTNNDVEGWHHRINIKANHAKLNLYQLIQLLNSESVLVELGVRMMPESGTSRHQKKKYPKLHTRLNQYWDEYCAKTRSTKSLLNACSRAVKHVWKAYF